ncbi:hypothetical protein [Mycobacterium decipiens]|uniref:Transmembrane protein n=1 Tax=Mycobacterium decipiens TaxID=1430326 RepID=A0A1X2LZA9_9MYCO|nr:hypothetical protein [Mycobacterium decipiens]OSC42612.1 hypothetical protein B8W66_03445 [Mycobacterium decipiens]
MTGPHSEAESPDDRQISVAELLARNGTIGAPAGTRRRRRRRGDSDAVTVAELTGEIPIVRDDHHEAAPESHPKQSPPGNGRAQVGEPAPRAFAEPVAPVIEPLAEEPIRRAYWSEPEPRWPKSPPQPLRGSGPELSEYPRPLRHTHSDGEPAEPSGAEHMSPDPVEPYAGLRVDVMDTEVREAEPATADSAYLRSYLQAAEGALEPIPEQTSERILFGGQSIADEVARRRGEEQAAAAAGTELDQLDVESDVAGTQVSRSALGTVATLWRGTLIVLQSMLAVAFGAGLFIAFDQLWRWNSIVALVLSVMVILGLVVSVRVVRKTEDIASTLIAVAVGALITLGPLALLQSG